MPRRITNLCGMSSDDIDYIFFNVDVGVVRTCYLCFKVNLPTLTYNEKYKRALVGIVLSNITDTINVTFHNLLDHNFNNFDYEHIEGYITKTYCELEIKTKEDLLFKYLDLMYVIDDTSSQYEMYFCNQCRQYYNFPLLPMIEIDLNQLSVEGAHKYGIKTPDQFESFVKEHFKNKAEKLSENKAVSGDDPDRGGKRVYPAAGAGLH